MDLLCLQAKQPGYEFDMDMKPIYIRDGYKGSGKLEGKVAIITGRTQIQPPDTLRYLPCCKTLPGNSLAWCMR